VQAGLLEKEYIIVCGRVCAVICQQALLFARKLITSFSLQRQIQPSCFMAITEDNLH